MKKTFFILSIIALLSLSNLFAQFEYSIELWDDYGDGWNDGYVDVVVNGEVVLSQLTLATGEGPESHTFTVVGGDAITTVYTPGGWAYENSYYIYNQNGAVVGADGLDGAQPTGISTPIIVMEDDDVDLGAIAISGNPTPTEEVAADYTVSIINNSALEVDGYTVKLMQVAAGDDIELGSIAGDAIGAGAVLDYEFTTTFAAEGTYEIYGLVEVAGDVNEANNATALFTVNVQASGIVVVSVGDGIETTNLIPANYYWKNSLVEQIYYAEELQIGGALTAVDFFYNFFDVPTISDLIVWVGETTLTDLSGGYIPSTELTEVYNGPLTYVIGEGIVHIEFDTPYAYSGGNLVVLVNRPMDTEYYSSQDVFYYTEDAAHPARTLAKYSDTDTFDPAEPYTDGSALDAYSNAAFYFVVEGMGSITGTVTSEGAPVADALVSVDGTSAATLTNASGVYTFPFIAEGTVDLTAAKHGFYDGTITGVNVVEDETVTADIVMDPLPNVQVSGSVYGSDYPEVGIVDAVVTLAGYEDYEVVTDADGLFSFPAVYASNVYDITVVAAGYEDYTAAVDVDVENVVVPDITILEIAIPAGAVVAVANAENTSVDLTWSAPGSGALVEFRYDDGTATGQLGFGGNANSVLGASHFHNAIINEVTWLLTSEAAHPEAIIFIFGLDGSGIPDTGQLLHESAPQPNVDDSWNTYVLPAAVEAPNGFFIGVCTPGIFTAIGTDDGVDEPWVFQLGTQMGIADWTAGNDWLDVGPAGFEVNFTIRANGIDLGEIDRTASNSRNVNYANSGLVGSSLNRAITPQAPLYNHIEMPVTENRDRVWESYKIHRMLEDDQGTPENWDLMAEDVADTTYTDDTFIDAANGVYLYAVVAVYTNDTEAAPSFSNTVEKGVAGIATFIITTNAGNAAVDADITFTAQDGNPDHVYEATTDDAGNAVIENVWFTTYDLEISMTGYNDYEQTGIEFTTDATITAVLNELTNAPGDIELVEIDDHTATITWGEPGSGTLAEFRYDDGVVTGQLGFGSNPSSVLGGSHFHNAVIDEVTWLLTSEAAHSEATIYIFGLDGSGIPDTGQLLHESAPQPNVDDSWNTYVLPASVEAPNGFFVGICTPGIFTALGTDDGVGDPWGFQLGTQMGIADWTAGNDWLDVGPAGFEVNFTVRALGMDLGELNLVAGNNNFVDYSNCGLFGSELDRPFTPTTPDYISSTRDLIGYNVYLDGDFVANTTENIYVFTGLNLGTVYEAGVTAVYTGDIESDMVTLEMTTTEFEGNETPAVNTALGMNYPNPFNPVTNIQFSLKADSHVNLQVYNVKGELVKTLINNSMIAGSHNAVWEGSDNYDRPCASGVYFYKMKAGRYTSTKKMILMK